MWPVTTTVGIVSAGAMGSAVGAAYRAGGARVVTTLAGRSSRTSRLAERAGLEVLADVGAVVAASDFVVSIVPPGQARSAARSLGGARLLVEANAVSPATVVDMAAGGVEVVDGSISGGPPTSMDAVPTRFYLSGPRAQEVAEIPAPWLDVRVVGGELGTASAIKMCTASYYKGRMALAAQALLTARAHGVIDVVLDDLGDLLPDPRSVALAASKAWRYVDEMREIAATQGAVGLPSGLLEGVAIAFAEMRSSLGDPEDVPVWVEWSAVLEAMR